MLDDLRLPPCTVAEWSDTRRVGRLRETRLGGSWRRWGRSRRALVWLGLSLVPLLVAGGQYWSYDIEPERQRLALTRPHLHHVFDAADTADQDTAVVDLVGLGNLDATATATALPELARIGQVWAVQYDNTGIDTQVISQLVATHAQESGVDRVVLVGHSMGGIIALEVAQHIHQDTDTEVLAVVLDCTPIDLHAVREESRDAGEDLLRWVGWLPGARESRSLRFLVETAARRDRFLTLPPDGYPSVDVPQLRDAAKQVLHDKIWSGDAASNGLIASQFRTIVASGAVDNLAALSAERAGKERPAIILLRPRHAWRDNVVDVNYTQRALLDRVGGPGGALFVVRMADTEHANPIQRPTEYNAAVGTQVVPFLERWDERAQSRSVVNAW